ncbi:pollen-specific leucine-rich repeat extensin-like protein 3 [Iris pallida]|uniref:Pollen-specific leucine-rich repeat extensin-like protein 3 n=1 Tax=Iris pallida TaxID=29817 RepID=A0AAX6GJZ3_IRIPA|nr:pollen-specific leucine-rich repeat extensin-like protein 3 [Iris pallida]
MELRQSVGAGTRLGGVLVAERCASPEEDTSMKGQHRIQWRHSVGETRLEATLRHLDGGARFVGPCGCGKAMSPAVLRRSEQEGTRVGDRGELSMGHQSRIEEPKRVGGVGEGRALRRRHRVSVEERRSLGPARR